MQDVQGYLEDLKNQLETQLKEYERIQNQIIEEAFSFELKRKGFEESVSGSIDLDSISGTPFQELIKKDLEVDLTQIDTILREVLKI